ncbi:hypothetical protein FA13DRAFT_1794870 [Coprinellus micaceus]|uniref:CHAT domain-containing protein n=1 Tax=Coprinellus micaceus TaxID=71717 RepID=A0A4Y7T008_COPMI|nr:hypothetical protein FA13DRAFT_1794870 [Coprinellus micaceus]
MSWDMSALLQGSNNLDFQHQLCVTLLQEFERSGNLSLLNRAIPLLQSTVNATPHRPGADELPDRLNDLGIAFKLRYQRSGELHDLNASISACERALRLTPDLSEKRHYRLSNLAAVLCYRFSHTTNLRDLNESIETHQKGVQALPQGHAYLAQHLVSLGNAFRFRFQHTGDLSDIAEAISAHQRAVHLSSVGALNACKPGWFSLPQLLHTLGISFRTRFSRTGMVSDVEEAIAAGTRAVNLMPEYHTSFPGLLNSLGNSLQTRFQVTNSLSDLDQAISVHQRGLKLTPPGHADLHLFHTNLGNAFKNRFNLTGEISDINEAIARARSAVQLVPHSHCECPLWILGLANALQMRFVMTGDIRDIDEAILNGERALDLLPKGHSRLPEFHTHLGTYLDTRAGATGNSEDIPTARSHYRSAATCEVGPPTGRRQAAKIWARRLCLDEPDSPEILEAFDTAIRLGALLAGLDQSIEERYASVADASAFALEAAAAACRLGEPEKAVEWLDHGRCLVWNQLSALRTPLNDLQAYDSALAKKVIEMSRLLEGTGSSRERMHSGMSLSQKISVEDEARSHLRHAQEWEELLEEVRAIPGFENFLRQSPCSALLENLPSSGPVVVINLNEERCDALALLSGLDEPLHIPLPNFSLKTAKKNRSDLSDQLVSSGLRTRQVDAEPDWESVGRPAPTPYIHKRDAGRRVAQEILSGLWKEVVKPILDTLGFSRIDRSSGEIPPRIWWCPTGALSFLPIHAAGVYGVAESESILDYAVSSYIPTLTALTKGIKNPQPIDDKISGLFLTAQPNAPGATPIPGTTREVQAIHAKATDLGVRASKVEGNDITVDECIRYLERFSSVHLASHASQNAANPLQSKFLFHKGTLDLATIMRGNLKNADLAFLSACQTSTGNEKLSDEAVHLAAGVLAAGYRRVVATMWSIGDRHAQEVAVSFYNYLWDRRREGSGSGFDGALSAYALHHATQQLRSRLDSSEASLLAWIPFVHFGN